MVRRVYPACAGIHPIKITQKACNLSLPRMRGDPPRVGQTQTAAFASTPHARGSTRATILTLTTGGVYPACAGIHLALCTLYQGTESLPRMRGDPPSEVKNLFSLRVSTPHARGSTFVWFAAVTLCQVYPACAGIHLSHQKGSCFIDGLPRMRGDPPKTSRTSGKGGRSTPHARGSTSTPM